MRLVVPTDRELGMARIGLFYGIQLQGRIMFEQQITPLQNVQLWKHKMSLDNLHKSAFSINW
ncbi:hypothetical protein Hanom_Chr00s004475g01722851 [Helianthus anomalus]